MKTLRDLYDHLMRYRYEIGFVEGGLDNVMECVLQSTCNDVQAKRVNELNIKWLKHDFKDRWFADPFILDVSGSEIVVLAEEFCYALGKGRIARLIIDGKTYQLKNIEIILEIDTHLSFPAIWRENGRTFIYPESWATGKLDMYEYSDLGCDIHSARTLCKESMADAIMTECFGKRMLFSTQREDCLSIYSFNNEIDQFGLTEKIQFNGSTARNAGDFFCYNNQIFRPAQISNNHYGEAIEIQQVIYENNAFRFQPICSFYSPHPKYQWGMHTLNSYKGNVVIDVQGFVNPTFVKSINLIKRLMGMQKHRG